MLQESQVHANSTVNSPHTNLKQGYVFLFPAASALEFSHLFRGRWKLPAKGTGAVKRSF